MSKKVFKTVGKIAGVVAGVALVASGIGSALGGTMLFTAFGASIAASTIATVAGVVSLGASMLSRPKAPATSNESTDRLSVSMDPRAPRKIVLGRTAMATDIRDQEFSNNQEYLHRFVVTSSHKASAIEEIWFDDKKAWSSSGGVTSDFAGYLTVTPILEGSAANAINLSARMGATRRYTGLSYVYFRFKLTGNSKKAESPFAQSIPSRVTIIGKGAPTYDPRLDSTVAGGSGAMRAADQTTWVWNDAASRNPALQLLWYLLGWRIKNPSTNEWRLAVGKGIPAARIDLASFITAANLCDEPVTLAAGGTQPRYRSDGVFSEADATGTVLDQLKAAMNAELDDVDGKIRITVLHNDLATPIADFNDDDILSGFTWDQTAPLDETYNVVRGTFIDPSTTSLYQAVDFPEVRIASLDGIDRIETVDFQTVQDASQAQRLVKQRIARMLYSGRFTATFSYRAWKVQKNDVIRLTFGALGWTNKLFRVVETAVQVDGQVPMVLQVENADIYLWDRDERPAIQPVEPTSYDPYLNPIYQDVVEPKYADGVPIDELRPAEPGATAGATPEERDLLADIDEAVGEAKDQISAIQGEIATIRSDVDADLDSFGETVASLESDLEDVRDRADRIETRQMAGSPNILPNGGQESSLDGYYAQGCTLAVNDGSFWGRYLAVQSSASNFLFNSPMAPAEAGVTITGALDTAFFASTGLMQVHLIFVAAAGGEIPGSRVSSPKFGGHNFDSSNARRAANAVTGVAPGGTANVLLQVEWTGVSGLVVASARMLKIEAAPTWSPFTIEAQNLRTTAVLQTLDESYAAIEDRVESAEGSVETLMEALTNGDGTVVQVRTRLETAEGEIEDLQQIVTSPEGTLAKMQQRIAADAPNMVSNGGLDDEMTGFSSNDQLTLHDTPEWGRWLRVSGSGSTLRINGPVIEVGGATTITGAVDTAFAATSGQMQVHLIFVDANGVEISGSRRSSAPRGGHNFDNGNIGRAANAVTGPRPANSPRALLQVEWTGVSGLVVAGLRMLKMEAAATWSPFSAEAQVLQRATAFRGLESSYASLSEEVEAADGKAESALDVTSSLEGTVASLNQRVSVGSPNLIENGGFEDGLTGYGSNASLGVSTGTTWGRWLSAVSGASSFYVNGPVAPADPGVSYTGSMDSAFSASAGLQYNQLIFLNAAGAEIDRSPARTRGGHNFDATTAGRDANATTRVAPAGTAKVLMQTRWEGVVGLVVAGMRMCKIEAGSTWSPYSNEAAAALTMTAARTAQGNYAALSQTVEAQGVDVENIIEAVDNLGGRAAMMVRVDSDGVRRAYGIEVNGTPIGGGVDINGDYFRISQPGGGSRTEYSDGVWRVYAGSMLSAWGASFGAANQFVRWFGPQVSSLSQCTEANAIEYLKTNGDAYFGGAITTGTFRNSVTGTLNQDPSSETVLGPFSTNGGTKSVSVSAVYNMSHGSFTSGPTLTAPGNPSFRVTLLRSRDGIGYSQIAQYNYTGTVVVTPAQGGDPGSISMNITGNFTFTDTGATGAAPMYYKVVIDSRYFPTYSGTSSGPANSTQRATIISTE